MHCQVLKIKTGPKFAIATVQAGNHIGECLAAPGVVVGPGEILVGADDQTVLLNKGDKRLFATSWPVSQPVSKATDGQQEQIKAESKLMGQAPTPIAMLQLQ